MMTQHVAFVCFSHFGIRAGKENRTVSCVAQSPVTPRGLEEENNRSKERERGGEKKERGK